MKLVIPFKRLKDRVRKRLPPPPQIHKPKRAYSRKRKLEIE